MIQTFIQVALTEKPALAGWGGGLIGLATASFEQVQRIISLTGGVLGCLAALAGFIYTVVRCYYLIKNKGKGD